MPSANPWPSEIRLNPARDVLTVAFDDGARFELRAELLRVESPSAEVRNHGGPKTIVLGKADVKIAGLEPAAIYAVRISFDDGHDTGPQLGLSASAGRGEGPHLGRVQSRAQMSTP